MRAWLSVWLLAFGLAATAHADERILDFFSDVRIEANGDMAVTETIRVNVENDEITHGLLRDFPTIYSRPDGTLVKVGFDVAHVRRDGEPEPYKLESLSNGVRIRMGSGDVVLSKGEHEYAIDYRTTRQIGFFKEFDELYWNATGTGWAFPIDHARARITLPAAVGMIQTSVYTGSQGSTDTNAEVTASVPGQVDFETTAPLGRYEGLTVAAAWPKGVVSPPSFLLILFYWVRDNIATMVSLLGFALLSGYYIAAYAKTRRRSPATIMPLFEPPDGMSAPAVRYVARQALDHTTFVVGMLELISLRAMRMINKLNTTGFERLEGGRTPPPALAGLLAKLFGKETVFMRDDLEGSRFDDAQGALEKSLTQQYHKLFAFNQRVASRGFKLWLLFLALCLGAAWWQNRQNAGFVAMSLPFTVPAIAVMTFMCRAWYKGSFNLPACLFAVFFLGPFLAGGMSVLLIMTSPHGLGALPGLLPLLLLPVVICAYEFCKGYTEVGYRVVDQIEGFKRYLTLAEGPRLQALVTPQEKLDVYERCLPYAVALDVGKVWSAAFAGLFTGVAAMAAVDAMQQFYAGHDLLSDDPSSAIKSISREMTPLASDSAASSSDAPGSSGSWSSSGSSSSSSSSSGSSGGGSSGGGGGGGGGSGW